MYFYYEGFHEAYHTDVAPEGLERRDRHDDNLAFEPISIPAILAWLVTVGVALCVIVTAIHALS